MEVEQIEDGSDNTNTRAGPMPASLSSRRRLRLLVHSGVARARGEGGPADGCAMLEAEAPVRPTVTALWLDASV
jgi:hypothetical protein